MTLRRVQSPCSWTPKVCKIMGFEAMCNGFGLLSYILLGSRYSFMGSSSDMVDGAHVRAAKSTWTL